MGVWAPTRIKRVIKVLTGPSTCPVHAMTDAGEAIVKLLGNPQGPHALAREWIGTRVAAWLGLPTFDMALVAYDGNLLIPGISPTSGPSIAFRFTHGRVWSGSAEDLRACAPAQIAGIAVIDTWLRNDDRYGPPVEGRPARINERNVYIADAPERLVAMDFTDALRLDRGASATLSPRLSNIAYVRDETVYGALPDFVPYLGEAALEPFLQRLGEVSPEVMARIVGEVPRAWDVSDAVRSAVVTFLIDRAAYLRRHLVANLARQITRLSEG